MLKLLTILFCTALFASRLSAEQEFILRHSLSKQFVVYGPETPARYPAIKRLPLDPNFLAVSCERIKQAVLAELTGAERRQMNWQTSGEGKIYVVLHPGMGQQPVITPINHSARANYRVDLPNQIEGSKLIETISEVVLLEMANRHGGDTFVPVPRWLSCGIAAQLKSTMPETLLLQANGQINMYILSDAGKGKTQSAKVQVDPIAQIRKAIETFAPLSFAELSSPENLPAERFNHYEECAQLFVHELFALQNGEQLLPQLLNQLPVHPDWQSAFFAVYQSQFKNALDAEKWWSLRLVNLTGRDASQLWSRDQSMERIDSALRIPMQRAAGSHYQTDSTLQEIFSRLDAEQQKSVLQKVTFQLRALRIRVQPEFVVLLDEYNSTLENFLENDVKQGVFKRIFGRSNLDDLRQSTREKLDALDRVRTALRNRPKPSTREEAMLSALEISSGNSATRKQ